MEAATPLRSDRVRLVPNGVMIDSLLVSDQCTAQLVSARAEAGEEPAKVITDAIEVGARVLDREQTGATVEVFRADLQRSAREVDTTLTRKTDQITQELVRKVDELFGPENGAVLTVLKRHFSDESSLAVQHRIKKAVEEVLADSREKLLKQFSSADGSNPLADFKHAQVSMFKRLAEQQDSNLRAMAEQMTALKLELQKLQAQRDKESEVSAERERSTAKGRPYEQAVFEAIDVIARAQGDDCDAVGDMAGAGGKRGDVVVALEGATGPARGRIVFEAKNAQVPKKRALTELDEALAHRDADYAVWVVPDDDKLPARTHPLREVNGDKLFVVYDPVDGSSLALEVGYSLARARVLMTKHAGDGIDTAVLRAEVERAIGAMENVRRIKSQLTTAAGGIDEARTILDTMATTVREHLQRIDELVLACQSESGDSDCKSDQSMIEVVSPADRRDETRQPKIVCKATQIGQAAIHRADGESAQLFG